MKRILFAAAVALGLVAASPLVLHGEEPSAPSQTPPAEGEAPVAQVDDDEAPVAGLGAVVAPIFQHDVETYTVTVVSGQGGPELSVVPKTGFHVNTLYPWKYQATDKTYKREDFQLTEEKAALTLGADQDGELRFSVCNDQTCLIEKVAVTVAAPK